MKKNKLQQLFLLIVTVPKEKKDIIIDLLEEFDVTICFNTLGKGSYDLENTKEVIFCLIKQQMIKDALLKIEDKTSAFNKKVSMAYAIPLHSIIGVSSYIALSNGGKK